MPSTHQRGLRTLSVNGQTFDVRLDFNAIADAEAHMDRGLLDIVSSENRTIKLAEARELFFQGVRGQHGIATREMAGEYLYEHGEAFSDVVRVIFECANDCFPGKEDDKKKS